MTLELPVAEPPPRTERIERRARTDGPVAASPRPEALLRAGRTATATRAAASVTGLVLALTAADGLAAAGFLVVLATAVLGFTRRSAVLPGLQEAAAAAAAVAIVGAQPPGVSALSILWLCAAVAGVVARGGRVHWLGRALVLAALLLPVARTGALPADHAAFALAALGLLLTCGRVTLELRSLLRRARYDADHDGLTDAWTSTALRDRLQAGLAGDGRLALLIVELDDFSLALRSNGHAAGDRLLVAATRRMRAAVGPDADIGRLGGHQFAVLGRGGAETVRAALAAPDAAAGPIEASIGTAVGGTDGVSADALLRAADVALRTAQRRGGGQIVAYDGEPLTDDPMTGARGALRRLIDGEGLAMAVQPIVDVAAGETYAFEALARFKTRGPSSPLHWFALAAEYGLRDELELAAVDAALRLMDGLPAGTRLCVNVSPHLLQDQRLLAALDEHDVAGNLILEATEDQLAQEDPDRSPLLGALDDRGVVLAVDDVGAGYAGLGQLVALRPGMVKLDRSIVAGVDRNDGKAALLEALVGYAERTGARLVAEGVETPEELAAVTGLGVRLVQGYLLGRPAPPWPTPDLRYCA